MKRRPWINKYGTVAVLLMLLLVMNLELRAFLLLANFIGLDLMIFFIAIQLRYLLPAVPSFQHPMRIFLCVASYTTLRFATRMIALLLAPADRRAELRQCHSAEGGGDKSGQLDDTKFAQRPCHTVNPDSTRAECLRLLCTLLPCRTCCLRFSDNRRRATRLDIDSSMC